MANIVLLKLTSSTNVADRYTVESEAFYHADVEISIDWETDCMISRNGD